MPSAARVNATANPSPPVANTCPPLRSNAARSSSSWRAREAGIASDAVCHSRVEPSMSVNRNVTVPVGAPPIHAR